MIGLAEHEALATRVCFDAEVPEAALRALAGDGGALAEARWRIYREMIRARLRKVVRAALPRTVDALGEPRLEARFTAWLADAPPDTRFFREVPSGFVHHAADALDSDDAQPWLGDLARYELACWRVLAAQDAEGEPVPIAFELAPVLSPAVELLDVRWAVHERTPEPSTRAVSLLVYRRTRSKGDGSVPRFDAVALELNPLARDLLKAWQAEGDAPLAARVQSVATARGVAIDEPFIDGLGTLLEDFLSRGVVLGSRRRPQ